jgi:hypothetical protein
VEDPQMKTSLVAWSDAKWHGRDAFVLANDVVRLVTLTGGGHIAEFRFGKNSGSSTLNPLWLPPWKSIEPDKYNSRIHSKRYGPAAEGRLLAGIAGHNLCLDYFGVPSEEEAREGLSVHGEAPVARWRKVGASATTDECRLRFSVDLAVAGLRFEREIRLRRGESVAYFREAVRNQRKADHFFHWTQHVTLGPPFLNDRDSATFLPASKARTFPHGYEGKELLESSRDFEWPLAPGVAGEKIDLTRPFIERGRGFLATALLDTRRQIGYIAAANRKENLLIGYCFRRSDFPWVAVWEENCAREYPPWNARCQARGLEFGSTPFPLSRREAFAQGPLFGSPHFSVVPAKGVRTTQYACFLAAIPPDFGSLTDLQVSRGEILLSAARSGREVRIPASGLADSDFVGVNGMPQET